MLPEVERLQSRFGVGDCCIVADRGMISAGTLEKVDEGKTPYILGTRMRKVKRLNTEILTRAGPYSEVYPESADRRKPAPLNVKEMIHWKPGLFIIKRMKILPAMSSAAFWHLCFDMNSISVWLITNKHRFEWFDIKQDLKALKQVEIEENGKCFAIRTECKGDCGKVFQSVRVALPPTIKTIA